MKILVPTLLTSHVTLNKSLKWVRLFFHLLKGKEYTLKLTQCGYEDEMRCHKKIFNKRNKYGKK